MSQSGRSEGQYEPLLPPGVHSQSFLPEVRLEALELRIFQVLWMCFCWRRAICVWRVGASIMCDKSPTFHISTIHGAS